ncbi:MAG: antibiotic biosynthesis monooxygenase [Mogibacterium sp.]|nr:antibiotic biosynthesis monooxygenase [Mogibacterium sp.]
MIVLNVTYKCKTDMREEFLEAIMAEGIDVACRAEDGNFKYDYYMAAGDENEMLLVEKWRDADALSAHQAQAHFKRLGELKNEFVEETILEKYYTENRI